MRIPRFAIAALVLSWCITASTFGQAGTNFTISDGNVFYTQGNSPTVNTSTGVTPVDFRVTGAAGTDHLFGNWWWFRGPGDTRENAFFNQVGPTVVAGDVATRTYNFPSFNATLRFDVNSLGPTFGEVVETLTITPLTAGDLAIFNYVDFFISGQDANDIVDSANTSLMNARDTVTNQALLFGASPAATNFQAAPFNVIRGALTNTLVNDLNNTNTANTAGDREGAFQWNVTMAPGQAIVLTERIVIPIPEPTALALLGFAGLALIRRR